MNRAYAVLLGSNRNVRWPADRRTAHSLLQRGAFIVPSAFRWGGV